MLDENKINDTAARPEGRPVIADDRRKKLREQLDVPEPEVFKFEKPGDELTGVVASLAEITFRDKKVWQLVGDGDGRGPVKFMLTGDLERQLVDERIVLPGDLFGIRLTAVSPGTGWKSHKVAVDPDRPRKAAADQSSAASWGDDDDVPPPDTEPPF